MVFPSLRRWVARRRFERLEIASIMAFDVDGLAFSGAKASTQSLQTRAQVSEGRLKPLPPDVVICHSWRT